jgi:hypothetical protein
MGDGDVLNEAVEQLPGRQDEGAEGAAGADHAGLQAGQAAQGQGLLVSPGQDLLSFLLGQRPPGLALASP